MILNLKKKNLSIAEKLAVILILACAVIPVSSQTPKPKAPLMGWASWNQYGVNINDSIIRAQADAMVSSGLADAGFKYINIDDGFFNNRNADGSLRINTVKFPYGMKALADYIHSKGLKAGFYSEAGANTCGSIWSSQPGGVGAGLYNHDQQDCDSIFKSWGYDFLKVDFCGGQEQKLDEQTRYTQIKTAIDNTGRTNVNYNVCRWQFPGVWVISLADSWRMSGDINLSPGSVPKWSEIIRIIDQNTFLAPYACAGHYNDMDMLEVGRGLTAEEDKSHFSMWCILSSPLVLGCNLAAMTQQTKDILANTEVIAVSQDTTGLQAKRIWDNGSGLQVWAKNLNGKRSNVFAVVLFNRNTTAAPISVKWKDLNIAGGAYIRDLWSHADMGYKDSMYTATVPAHGVVMLKVTGNGTVLKEVFEAEYAWINNFNLTQNSVVVADQGRAVTDATCSGRAKAGWLGNRADNYIEFREVYADSAGRYPLSVYYQSGENRNMSVTVNGTDTLLSNLNSGGWSTIATKTISVNLNKGYNIIRMSNATGWMPDIDKIKLDLKLKPSMATVINGSDSVCTGATGIKYDVASIAGATSYIWTLPAGVTGSNTARSITVNFDSTAISDTIRVRGVNQYGYGEESALKITMKNNPVRPLISLVDDILQSDAAIGNQWYINSSIIKDSINSTLTPKATGNYYVITTLDGCASQPSNIISYVYVGINDVKNTKGINFFPNPTTGILTISLKNKFDSDYSVDIYDTAGNVLTALMKNKSEKEITVDLSNLTDGVYILRVINAKKCYRVKVNKISY
jgi:hypothetical protein